MGSRWKTTIAIGAVLLSVTSASAAAPAHSSRHLVALISSLLHSYDPVRMHLDPEDVSDQVCAFFNRENIDTFFMPTSSGILTHYSADKTINPSVKFDFCTSWFCLNSVELEVVISFVTGRCSAGIRPMGIGTL